VIESGGDDVTGGSGGAAGGGRVRVPLRVKILSVISLLLLATMGTYLYLALTLFSKDKLVYVYDLNAVLVGSLSEQARSQIDLLADRARWLAAETLRPEATDAGRAQAAKTLLAREPDLLRVRVLKRLPADGSFQERLALQREQGPGSVRLPADGFARIDREAPLPLAAVAATESEVWVQNSSQPPDLGILTLAVPHRAEDGSYVVALDLGHERLLRLFGRSSLHETYLVDGRGEVLAHPEARNVTGRISLARHPLVEAALAAKVERGVKEFTAADGSVRLGAYGKVGSGGLVVLTEISKGEALRAGRELVRRSLLFGVALVLAALLVSIFFSRLLTAPLRRLRAATEVLASGKLDARVGVSSRDEIGDLSRTFNEMAAQLQVLVRETAAKAIMEKELEVARSIQQTLIPATDVIEHRSISLASHFRPATQCGGDWWAYQELASGKLLLVIGDVTGHGVPAAMITAAAKAACDAVRALTADALDVARLLEVMSRAIYESSRRQFVMTCFAGIIDPKARTMTFANAAHNFPYLHRAGSERQALTTLVARGSRLGDAPDNRYEVEQQPLLAGDVLVLYTDGVVECENPAGEQFGERRFRAAIRAAADQPPAAMRDAVLAEARAFYGAQAAKDDITLVVARIRE
jgi:serine phosphatase RsbU (regulator of sigma subunit)